MNDWICKLDQPGFMIAIAEVKISNALLQFWTLLQTKLKYIYLEDFEYRAQFIWTSVSTCMDKNLKNSLQMFSFWPPQKKVSHLGLEWRDGE